MKKINTDKEKLLSHQDLISVLDYNESSGIFVWKKGIGGSTKKGKEAGNCRISSGYLDVNFFGKTYRLHRLAWFYVYKKWPENYIDHINGDKQDNRILNLRDVTHRENMLNNAKTRSGSLGGCYFEKRRNKWQAQIRTNNKTKYLGRFNTEKDAHEAYKKALRLFEELGSKK